MKSPATLHCKWGCSELLLPGNLQDDTFLDSLFWNALSWEPLSLRLYKTPSVTTEKEMPWESFHVPVEIQKTISRAVDVYLKIHLCKFLGSQKLDTMFSTASLIQYDFCEHYTGKNYLLQTLLLWTIWLFFFFFLFLLSFASKTVDWPLLEETSGSPWSKPLFSQPLLISHEFITSFACLKLGFINWTLYLVAKFSRISKKLNQKTNPKQNEGDSNLSSFSWNNNIFFFLEGEQLRAFSKIFHDGFHICWPLEFLSFIHSFHSSI